MSTARGLLFALVVVTCAACRSQSGAASLGEVPVVAPFDAMGLPTKGGVVWTCNVARMKVVYDRGDKGELGEAYGHALEQHGWTSMQPAAGGEHQWLGRYRHAHEVLTLDVHDADFEGKVPNGVEVFLSIKDAT
jgi:hypothetical protein